MSGKLLVSSTPRTAKRAHHRARRAVRSVCDAPPAKPTGPYVTYDQLGIHRHHRFRSIFGCHPVNSDTDGYPINPRGYHWQFRECTSVGNDLWGGKWPSGVKRRGDPEVNAEQVGRHHFHHGHWYQCRWQAYNSNGDGGWSDWSDPTQFLDGVPALAPTVTVFDTDQHKMRLEWTNPTDPSNSLIHHRNTYENVIQIATGSGFSNVLKQIHVKAGLDGHHVIKWPKPGTTTRWARVGAKTLSGQIEWSPGISSNRADPPTPATPLVSDVTFKHGGKHRVSAKFSYNYDAGGYGDDDVTAAGAHWQYEKTNPTNSDDVYHRSHKRFAPGNSIQGHFFLTHLRPGHKIRVMLWVRDSKGHYAESAWSPPITVYDPRRPGAVRNLLSKKVKGVAAVKATFDPPDRFDGDSATNPDFIVQDVSHYEADLLDHTAAVVDQNLHLLALRVRFETVDEAGVPLGAGGPYKIAVRSIGHGPNVNPDGTPGTPPTTNPPAGATPDPPPAPASDGVPPASSPAPVVSAPDRYMARVDWIPISNADPVIYEVWYKQGSDFGTPGSTAGGTKAGELSGSSFDVAPLPASTNVYVRTVAKDRDGSAAASSSGSATTRAAQSDGSPPASSPTPVLTADFKTILATWAAPTNNDPVTVEVHVSTSSGFTPGAGTKVGETRATAFAIAATAAGAALANGTTYYVKTVAKDEDGSAAASAQASATTLYVQAPDVSVATLAAIQAITGKLYSPTSDTTKPRTVISDDDFQFVVYGKDPSNNDLVNLGVDSAGRVTAQGEYAWGSGSFLTDDYLELLAWGVTVGYLTPALRQTKSKETGPPAGTTTSTTITPALPTQPGNLLVIFVQVAWLGGSPTVSTPAGWTSAVPGGVLNDGARLYCFYRPAAPTTTSVGLSATGGVYWSAVFQEWSGIAPSSPLDKTQSASGTSLTPSTGTTVTTTQTNDLALAALASSTRAKEEFVGDWTNGFVEVGQAGSYGSVDTAYLNATSTGTYQTQESIQDPPAYGWGGIIVTFKAASSVQDVPKPDPGKARVFAKKDHGQTNLAVSAGEGPGTGAFLSPIGCWTGYVGTAPPDGWVFCDGGSYDIKTYEAAYNAMAGVTSAPVPDPNGLPATNSFLYGEGSTSWGLNVVSLSASTRSGTDATFTTVLAHGFAVGDYVVITGSTGYNGKYQITSVPDSTHFHVTLASDPGANNGAVGWARTKFPVPIFEGANPRFPLGLASSGTGSILGGTGGGIDHSHSVTGSTANESAHTHAGGTYSTGITGANFQATYASGATGNAGQHAHNALTGSSAGGSAHSHGAGSLGTGTANAPYQASHFIFRLY